MLAFQYVGQSEAVLNEVFNMAKKCQPCCIIVDEADYILMVTCFLMSAMKYLLKPISFQDRNKKGAFR